jgi:Flp pilus assembly pilin Flp
VRHDRRARRGGQSSVEYAVVCAAIALTLGIGMANSDSVLWQFVDALRVAYQKFTYAISLSE